MDLYKSIESQRGLFPNVLQRSSRGRPPHRWTLAPRGPRTPTREASHHRYLTHGLPKPQVIFDEITFKREHSRITYITSVVWLDLNFLWPQNKVASNGGHLARTCVICPK